MIDVGLTDIDTSWQAAPLVLCGSAILSLLFLQAWLRLRRRGRADLAGWDRPLLFFTGMTLGTMALVSPLDTIGERYLVSAHMLQHMLIADSAPALVLLAVRGPLLFFLLPPLLLRPLARIGPLRTALGGLLHPAVAFAAWALAFGLWHVPVAYDFAIAHTTAHDLEHLSFILAGTLVWAQMIDPARRAALRRPERIGFAVALFAGGQALAYVLLFSFSPLYPAYADQPERLFGIGALADQRLAGGIMMVAQTVSLGLFAWFLFGRALRKRVALEGTTGARTS
jgi:putative membrane protein